MEKILKKIRIFCVLALICLTGFFILPNISMAVDFDDIDLRELGKYLELPEKKVENLLHSLINLFNSEWINLMASGHSTAEERAVPSIMKRVVQVQALNHLLIDAPIQITWAIVENATMIARVFLTKDFSAVLNEFEKQSVKKAVAFGMSVLLEQEIKISPGAIDFEYISQKGEKKTASFQYIIAYQPINIERGEVLIRFYSPKSLEPPENKGSIGGIWGISTDLAHDLPPFIVNIRGFLQDYKWVGSPSIQIDFPKEVPDLGIKPLSLWEKYVLKPISGTIKNVEFVITKITGTSLNLTGAWDKIKSFVSGVVDFLSPATIISYFAPTESEPSSTPPLTPKPESNPEPEPEPEPEPIEEQTLPSEAPAPESEISLEDLQKMINDISREMDIIAEKLKELGNEKQDEELKKEKDACLININTASKEDLEKITGIGPVLAQRIIDARSFSSIYELINVSGIGETTLKKIIDQGCVYVDKINEQDEEAEEQTETETEIDNCSVNINTASKEDLEKITGIGPVLAQKIIDARSFSSVYELIKVSGIGQTTLQKIIDQNCAFVISAFSGGGSSSSPAPILEPDPGFLPEEIGTLEVVINEIAWTGTKASPTHQWIELYNNTEKEIDFSGWQLSWNKGENNISLSSKISPQSYFLMAYGCIDINTAPEEDLDKIIGIGPALAQKIIEARPFSSLEDLIQVSGIGEITLQKIIEQGLACVVIGENNFSEMEIDFLFLENLNENSTSLELFDSKKVLIDKVGCIEDEKGDCLTWFAGDNETKQTMERINSILPGIDSNNWANNNLITRNGLDMDGNRINGTPGEENSVSKNETIVDIQNFNSLFEVDGFSEITLTFLGSPYIFKYYLQIDEGKTLNIEPGTILKFDSNWGAEIDGTLKAIGEENKEIVFTSLEEPDFWNGISFSASSTDSELNWVRTKYGKRNPRVGLFPTILVENSSIILINSTIENYFDYGIKLINSDSLIEKTEFSGRGPDASRAGIMIQNGSPSIKNCLIKNNEKGIFIEILDDYDLPLIEDNVFKENDYPIYSSALNVIFKNNQGENNQTNGISVSNYVKSDIVWHKNEIPYYIINNFSVIVNVGATLTIEPGVRIELGNDSSLDVNGTVISQGTVLEPIIFTAYPGQSPWKKIYFSASSTNSKLENTIVSQGGYYSNYHQGSIWVKESVVEFENLSCVDNLNATCLHLENSNSTVINSHFENNRIGLKIQGTENLPQLINNSFKDNEKCDIYWPSGGEYCQVLEGPGLEVECGCCPY